ncbi:MAG: thioesterase [Proteobacteria bacterium]|nr:thioesterase [Pseudomonadota bacterium]
MVSSDWFVRPQPKLAPAARLLCLPYAGGSAATYIPWSRLIPADVELIALQPPGRGSRMAQAPHAQMAPLVAELMGVFAKVTDRPYVLFGHSLGSRVGFEVIVQCQRNGLPLPAHFIASGSRAPYLAKRELPIHDLPDAQFVEALRELDGTPEEILDNSELMQWLLPLLRADFRIADLHRASQTRIHCPLTVLAGTEDKTIPPQDIEAWRDLAGGECDIHWVSGGHFFVERNREWVLEQVNAILGRVRGAPSARPHL